MRASRLFLQVPPEVWGTVAHLLAGSVWSEEAAILDLQAAYLLEGEDGIPTCRDAAERWGWGKTRAGALIHERKRWLLLWCRKARGEV